MNLGTAVKTAVKQELAKAIENKYIMRLGSVNSTIGTSYTTEFVTPDIPLNSSMRPLLPTLVEGTDGNQRVGKAISPKFLKVRGTVSFANTFGNSAVRELRLMFVTNKSVKDTLMLTSDTVGVPNYAQELLWNGQTSSPTAYLGCGAYYNQLPINRKQFNVIKDIQIRLAKSLSSDAGSASQTNGAITSQITHDFEVMIPCPSKLLYDGGVGTSYPSNFAPVLAVGWVDPLGATAVGAGNPKEVIIEWSSALSYEDA